MTKPSVLIVEDDPKLNEIISIALRADFGLETCMDGNTALEYFKHSVPQIVVLDLNLPGISGTDIVLLKPVSPTQLRELALSISK